ncbi:MAG: hypothetical protein V4583_15610 [Pseudomonadota bacterium]
MHMHPLPHLAPGLVLAVTLVSPGFAQETWGSAAIEECRSDFDTCEALAGFKFPLDVSADGKTARLVTPGFRLKLPLSQADEAKRTFATVTDDGIFAVTLEPGGAFVGLRTQEVFGTMVDHRLTATCKKAAN